MPPKLLQRSLTIALSGQSPHCIGVEASSVQTHRPRGPWLGSGLCCPAASTLTTASSALLGPPGGLLSFVRRVFASEARTEKVPDLSCVSFDPCRLPYPGGPDGRDCCSSTRDAFALMGGARRPRYSHSNRFMWGDSRGCRVRVMLRPGSLVALHRQGRLLELSPHRVASMDRRAFLRGQQSIAAAGLAPADTQPYRLRPKMSPGHLRHSEELWRWVTTVLAGTVAGAGGFRVGGGRGGC